MPLGSILDRLARAYMERERMRLGIPAEERAAAESSTANMVRQAQAARIAQQLELAPAEAESEQGLRAAQAEQARAHADYYRDPPDKQWKPPETGSFADYVTRKYGQQPTPEQIAEARKVYGQADDRALRPSIQILQSPEGYVAVNRHTRQALPVEGGDGQLQPGPTAEMRNVQQRQSKAAAGLSALDVLGEQLITESTVLSQRTKMTAEAAKAQITQSPKYRAYQDSRRAMAINLAAIMNQGRPTEPDAQAAADIIPDVFSDTPDSARIKRDFVRQMLASPDEARDMLVDFKLKYGAAVPTAPSGNRRIKFDAQGNVVKP